MTELDKKVVCVVAVRSGVLEQAAQAAWVARSILRRVARLSEEQKGRIAAVLDREGWEAKRRSAEVLAACVEAMERAAESMKVFLACGEVPADRLNDETFTKVMASGGGEEEERYRLVARLLSAGLPPVLAAEILEGRTGVGIMEPGEKEEGKEIVVAPHESADG